MLSEDSVVTDSGNGFVSVRHQAITLTNTDTLSNGPLGTNFSEIFIDQNGFENVFFKMVAISQIVVHHIFNPFNQLYPELQWIKRWKYDIWLPSHIHHPNLS